MLLDIPEIRRQYDSFELMDEGGMGSIYRVRHRFLDELRVIKTIRADVEDSEDIRARFLREAKVAAKLRHPNIASIFDFSIADDGTAWIVMEYIEGINLFQYYRGGDRLSLDQFRLVATEGLSALAYLHSMNFLHRDISSDNLMLTHDTRGRATVKLIDLGLAKSLKSVDFETRTGVILGKVRYISPEQIRQGSRSSEVDARSDLYSFGVVLYELLTGRLPLDGTDDVSMIAAHLYQRPTSFEISDPEGRIPPGVRTVLVKALEKAPERRYASAEAFRTALESEFEGNPLGGIDRGDEPTTARAADTGVAARGAPAARQPTEVLPGRGAGGTTRRERDQAGSEAADEELFRVAPPRTQKGSVGRRALALALAAVLVAAGLISWTVHRAKKLGAVATSEASATTTPVAVDAAEAWGSYHALVIGNDHYRQLPELRTAVNDARSVAELLERRYGFQVSLLEDATRKQIMDALYELESSLTGRDNLLIYYAGHGFRQHQREYWQPVDAAEDSTTYWLSTEHEISGAVDRMSARHVLVVADSCYAGSTGRLSPVEATTDELVRRPSRLVLSSGSLSPIVDDSGDRHSIFARVFLDALRNTERPVPISNLFAIIASEVPKEAQRIGVEQSPTLSPLPLASDAGGMFFFVPDEEEEGREVLGS